MAFAVYHSEFDEFQYYTPIVDVVAGTPVFVTPTMIGISAHNAPKSRKTAFRISGVFRFVKVDPQEDIPIDSGLQFIADQGMTAGVEPYQVIEASPAGVPYVHARINPAVGGSGGSGGGNTNITVTPHPTNLIINSSTGSPGTFPLVTNINAGAMPPGYKQELDYITVTTNVDLDIINGLKHPAATGSNAIDVTVGQVVSLIVSPTAGNQLTVTGNGAYVAASGGGTYTQVANLAARGTVVAGKRVKVATNQLIYVGYSGSWVPESLVAIVDATTFGGMSEMEENQFVIDVETAGAYGFTWSTANGFKQCFGINGQSAALRLPEYTVTATNIANSWAPILLDNQAAYVSLQFRKFLVELGVDATFNPATGVLDWGGLALEGVIEEGDVLKGVYWA